MSAAWVIPSIDAAFGRACKATLAPEVKDRLLMVDNTEHNHGVAASWNLGLDFAICLDAEWLVICSESMRFGPPGGLDYEAGLASATEDPGPSPLVRGICDGTCAQVYETGAGNCRNGYGWHLIAIHHTTWERVGCFDEVFYPAFWEETDYLRRMGLAGIPDDDACVTGVDAHLVATEHTLASGLLGGVGWWTTAAHYERKWGALPEGCAGSAGERFATPYDDPALRWNHTGPGWARERA